ncbi:nucleotidyltransferase domain-containing protein [Candidatus Woesearchaeota archaeon]|nr:nucleotidyltransferase domain-containing protein [Candidatus Woesearchaeota archaeon]
MKGTIVRKKERKDLAKTALIVLDFLASNPFDTFSLAELAKKAKVPKSTASRAVEQLAATKYVTKGSISNLLRIQFNRENHAALGYKIGNNLIKVYKSGVVDHAVHVWKPRSIILFGSYRKGEDAAGSDIDIAVELDNGTPFQIIELQRVPEVKHLLAFEQETGRHFKFHLYSRKSVDKNLFVNIANGILLFGLLEVKP